MALHCLSDWEIRGGGTVYQFTDMAMVNLFLHVSREWWKIYFFLKEKKRDLWEI
jgi:hypothetical protein